jgi:N-acyl-D-aspartate/D-glutamate deacylase
VTWDVTVFPRGGGAWAQYLPAWVRAGGAAATTGRLRDPSLRARIRGGIEASGWLEWSPGGFDDELIVKVSRPETRWMAGRTIGEIARERDADPLDTALDLLIEDPQFWTGTISKRQADLDRMIAHPLGIPVTDGMAAHPVKHRDLGIMPKTFGSFPQILGRYVREAGVMTLEAAVAKMTSVAAGRAGLADRGVLADGKAADLFLFDPDTIANRATDVEEPTARPAGIERVMVNGRWVVVGGAATGERPGRAL